MRPAYLKSGDEIAVVATAKKIEKGQLDPAIDLMESWGLKVRRGAHLDAAYHQFAGTDEQRTMDLQRALDDDGVKGIVFARGGYGTARIIDQLDWETFRSNPKWLCGFSDLTALHGYIYNQMHVETLHSSMPIFFKDGISNTSSESLRKALFGETTSLTWDAHPLNRGGNSTGKLVGGNLSVLCSVAGSHSDVRTDGNILVLEDLSEYLYHLDRMMIQLKRSGKLEHLNGMVVGQFTDMMDGEIAFGKSANEVILDAVSEYDFPVAFSAPIGHVEDNEAFYHGRAVQLSVLNNQSSIAYE